MSSHVNRNGFASAPFDEAGSIRNVVLRDSFISAKTLAAITTSGTLNSDLLWTVTDEVGAATADVEVLASEAGNQGIIRLNVGATTPADGDLVSMMLGGDDNIILDGNGVYFAARLRIPDVDASKVFFGLTVDPNGVVNGSETDAVAFVWDPEDAANVGDALFLYQLNDAGVDVETASTISYVEDDWVLLECAADDTGATFRLTTEDGSETVSIDGTITATMACGFKVENVAGAEEFVEIDDFVFRYFLRDKSLGLGA